MVSLMSSWEVGNWVKAVAFSPDATRIAVTTDIGNSARICDTYTGLKLVGPLEGHTEVISAFAFSPDGRTLASGSGDATVRLWDTETGTAIVGPLSGHINWINSVTFSLDGRFVVSAASDKTIRIWDAHTGETARGPIRPGHHWAQYLAPVSGGRLAISGHAGYVFTVYDMDSCTALFECAGHESSVQSISCSPDGRLLASASADHTVRIWDAASGIQIGQPLEGHLAQATLAKFSPDSRYIVSSAYDSVRIWDVKTREMYGEPLPNHKVSVVDATFTPDGNRLVSAYWQGIVKIWDVRSLGILTETANTESGMTAKALETQVTGVNV
ncbi:hypothetical protein FRC12_007968 [Ceratobasidium sp. 428]|nr:hypothetical protein FRC12_007968 [Ceratobasidium sp. 428]